MSETSAMGSFGSKEENQDDSSKNNKKRKDDSPERYRPYCDDDSDTETYDTQALSIMDINDIIGVQTGPVEESTLESEIAALSEIIGDTGDAATSPEKQSTDEDKKDLVDPLGAEKIEEKPSTTLEDNKPGKKEEEDDTKDLTNLNNSLSLIGEAYISEDSLENDPDELHIGKEPKVVFSCKPLVDKRISQDISAEKTETIVETSETIDSVSITIDEVDKIEAITEECLLKSDEEKLVQEPEQTVDEIMDEIEETLLDDFDKKESKDEEVEKVEKETLKEEEEKKITEVTVELEERRISEQEEKKEEIINSLAEESDEMEIDEPQFEEYPGEKLAEMENEENIVEETMDIVEVIETIEEDKEVETDELNSEIVELDKMEEDDEKVPISTEETEIIHEELKEVTIQDDISSVAEVPADLETSELKKTIEYSKTEDVNDEELDVPVCQEASEQSSEVEVSTEIEELINEEITNEVDDKSSLPVEPSSQISKDELSEQQEETIKPDGQEEEEVSLCSTNQEEYSEIFGDNNSQGTQEMVDRILDTVQSGLSSILEQQDNVNEEISEMLETTEDLSPTQNDLIEDLDKKLVSETEKLLETELKDDADNQGDLLNLNKEEEKEPVVDNDDDDGELNKSDDKSIEVLESKEQNEDVELLDKSEEEIVEPSSTGDSEIDEPKVDGENEEEKIEEIEEEEIEENKEEKSSEGEKSSENIILVEEQEEEIEEITEEILESSHELDTPEFEVSFAIPDEEKMDISDELLEDPLGDVGPELEGLQSSSQMDTELESAVKFLQESEENDIESPIILSSKFPHSIHSEKITVLAMDELTELPDNTEAMEIENSMAITEAEIISEAAKLENEKKEELTTEKAQKNFQNIVKTVENKIQSIGKNDSKLIVDKTIESSSSSRSGDEKIIENPLESIVKKKSIVFPKTSILEERLKIPPKIEIPIVEPRICDTPSTPKTSLLIQRDARIIQQTKMLESPKSSREDQKITDTPKKDLEKSDFENVGSPRIILKIAKSAIADCAEQKSPKSPKVHSATHSPNPEDSPGQKLGKIKLKLSKDGHPSIIPTETNEKEAATSQQWHTEGSSSLSPLGMIIKLSKSGDASIVQEHVNSPKRTESPIGMKLTMKVSKKTGDASIIQAGGVSEKSEDEIKEVKTKQDNQEYPKRTDSPIGMKIKFSTKGGDTSIVPSDHTEEHHSQEIQKRVDSPSMKIKFSKKGGGTSIVPVDTIDESKNKLEALETPRRTESPQNHLGMKFKLSKSGDASIIHAESSQLSPGSSEGLGMKFKLSKSGDASIVSSDSSSADLHQTTESMKIKFSKTGHPMIVPTDETAESHFSTDRLDKSQITIEQLKKSDELSLKRKETIASPVEFKKAKIENNLSQILPEMNQDKKQSSMLDNKSSSISRNQMNVINQEISITHVQQIKQPDLPIGEKLKSILTQNKPIQEEMVMMHPRPELIIVNENSNSSQDVMIIDEMPIVRMPEVKIPKKRGRPRRIGLPVSQQPPKMVLKDPLMDSDGSSPGNSAEAKESERPKRTCRSSQKSYAPPKRGRGRGRGKRKMDRIDRSDINQLSKKARLDNDNYEDEDDDDDLTAIENRTTSIMTLDDDVNSDGINSSSELYKALRQPLKSARSDIVGGQCSSDITTGILGINRLDSKNKNMGIKGIKSTNDVGTPVGQNWLTPTKKSKQIEPTNLQVIDEETRMSAESFSRSQTPARQISAHGTETIINEESQGSVLSTATTESEKVKVKSRRMEINFDPDEGPFTVDKIAEYEWPLDRKGDTSMIQEQISQYLGVKSFKRKYPDLKRRMVDMEERNYLRENHLVSESMCDMGLTAVGSSEVLDIMCSDFPDHYEEYRKHMREKQIKEHSKKQKELTAAANAEKNRIDLAEMAVQSALSWNINFNKSRKETRKCSLDLQTFTIHVPKKQQKVEEYSKNSNYPVTLIPGQYTDYYREYTPAELRYYPLNTVIYGPMRPNERKFDSQSEGSQSDSDSDSSSDDSSCSSSEGTQDTEESQSTMDEVDIELSTQKDKTLKCKMCLKHLNKNSKSEILVQCGTCNGYVHPSCIDVTLDMVPHIQAYAWQCTDCKTCAQCHDPADEDKMLFCDMCDRGYHIYCVGLRRVPQGRWHCTECAICSSCGSRDAGGINGDRNGVAQWQHEYKKGEKNTRVYVSTLCVPCSKLWRKGRYCPHCSRCHTVPRLDLEENLVHCSACDKYLHLDCVENKGLIFDRKKYQCDLCLPKDRQHVVKNLFPKIVRG